MDSSSSRFTQNEGILKGLLEGSDEAWQIVTKQGLHDVKKAMGYNVTKEDAEDILQNAIVEFFKALKKHASVIDNLIHFAARAWKRRVFAAINQYYKKRKKDRNAGVQSEVIETNNEEADSYSLYDKHAKKINYGNKEMDVIIDIVIEEFLVNYSEVNKKIFRDQRKGETFVQTAKDLQMSVDTIKSRYRKMKQEFQVYYNYCAN
jgi:RNA polymerase sigma factor (sigma-70 family)